jgi:hypothetical protein
MIFVQIVCFLICAWLAFGLFCAIFDSPPKKPAKPARPPKPSKLPAWMRRPLPLWAQLLPFPTFIAVMALWGWK